MRVAPPALTALFTALITYIGVERSAFIDSVIFTWSSGFMRFFSFATKLATSPMVPTLLFSCTL